MKRFTAAALAAILSLSPLMAPPVMASAGYLQCVPYARERSGVQIRGDAWTWWRQAENRFRTGDAPELGSVLVFRPHGRMTRGHVAVVSDILTDRLIHISHANWGGSRGRIEENVVVADVSAAGDWSRVKVWYGPLNGLGTTVYPVYGFIHADQPTTVDAFQTAAQDVQDSGQP